MPFTVSDVALLSKSRSRTGNTNASVSVNLSRNNCFSSFFTCARTRSINIYQLDCEPCLSKPVQSAISDFGFEMQESSNFSMLHLFFRGLSFLAHLLDYGDEDILQ